MNVGPVMRKLAVPLAALTGGTVYVFFCLYGGHMPRCPFKWLTGFDCPGCGSQRAVRALMRGELMEAWSYNLLLPFVVLYLAAIIVLPLSGARGARRMYEILTSVTAVSVVLAVFILWWVVRNIIS